MVLSANREVASRLDSRLSTSGCRPKRYDVLAGIELARAPRRLRLAWESGSLVARFKLSAAVRPTRQRADRQAARPQSLAKQSRRLDAGWRPLLGASMSDEPLGAAEIRTPAFRRSDRARGIVQPWRRPQCRRVGSGARFHAKALAGSMTRGIGACLGRPRLQVRAGVFSFSGDAVVSSGDPWHLHVSDSGRAEQRLEHPRRDSFRHRAAARSATRPPHPINISSLRLRPCSVGPNRKRPARPAAGS